MATRTDIPVLIGHRVTLLNLKNQDLNDRNGDCLGWNEEKERFIVKMDHDQSLKLVRVCNLQSAGVGKPFTPEHFLYLISCSDWIVFKDGDDCRDFKKGDKIINKVFKFDNRNDFESVLSWLDFLPRRLDFPSHMYRKTMLEYSIEKSSELIQKGLKEYPDLMVDAKIIFTSAMSHLAFYFDYGVTDFQRAIPILVDCAEVIFLNPVL